MASAPSEDDAPSVPSLVSGRARRANAGNRMRQLIEGARQEQEVQEEDAEAKEVFAELAEDEDFGGSDAEDKDDVSLSSSSGDEGDAGEEDEEAGEKALVRQERVEKAAKRKARHAPFKQGGLGMRKRVKIDPMAAAETQTSTMPAPALRPRKKSERVSYLPAPGEAAAVRASSRRLAVQNKEETHNRLKEKEEHRLKTLMVMEAAAKRKEQNAPKAMTQADRLAEAARVEKQNSKSLNRWEAAEKKREEEQRAKLEALKNRKMEGPFIRFYSGPAVWVNGKLKHVGKGAKIEETDESAAQGVEKGTSGSAAAPTDPTVSATHEPSNTTQPASLLPTAPPLPTPPRPLHPLAYPNSIMFAPPQGPAGFLDGIHYYASLPDQLRQQALHPHPYHQPLYAPLAPSHHPVHVTPPPPPPPRKLIERATRNLITLHGYDDLKPRDKDALCRALFEWQRTKLGPKTAPAVCAITARPARYRDPGTGLAFVDVGAYRFIRRLVGGSCVWSKRAECFAGPKVGEGWGRAAGGVPGRFLVGGGGGS
ncbi:hypothetical protein W97_07604 [Coniosporium apollinis CBS 100218]|uniref:Vps72/YL1 C-terminal domain-containing protein n=1 Tax=Coniosporium apollinis (strain CBS 100218) TaxID=1168221 RepID=R7Z335_CONA1|nr:uncharacterized protein W97_07604 [Coniosporium apollinis CBS 100218]EON68346.1 hypothetical protein W97_07604 [Coniosporium apollinis CBS 100218]